MHIDWEEKVRCIFDVRMLRVYYAIGLIEIIQHIVFPQEWLKLQLSNVVQK